jgi:hypothetical protein
VARRALGSGGKGGPRGRATRRSSWRAGRLRDDDDRGLGDGEPGASVTSATEPPAQPGNRCNAGVGRLLVRYGALACRGGRRAEVRNEIRAH